MARTHALQHVKGGIWVGLAPRRGNDGDGVVAGEFRRLAQGVALVLFHHHLQCMVGVLERLVQAVQLAAIGIEDHVHLVLDVYNAGCS